MGHSIAGIPTASGQYRQYSAYKIKIRLHTLFIHHLPARVACLAHIARKPYTCCATCFNGQYCRTVAWVSCVCMCCMCSACTCSRLTASQSSNTPAYLASLLPCIQPPPTPPHFTLRLTDAYEIVDLWIARSEILRSEIFLQFGFYVFSLLW